MYLNSWKIRAKVKKLLTTAEHQRSFRNKTNSGGKLIYLLEDDSGEIKLISFGENAEKLESLNLQMNKVEICSEFWQRMTYLNICHWLHFIQWIIEKSRMILNLFLRVNKSDTSWLVWIALIALYFRNWHIIDDFLDPLYYKQWISFCFVTLSFA